MTISPETRRIVFDKYNNRCVFCGKDGDEVDHIVPVILGGSDDLENLQLLCEKCNMYKSGKNFFARIPKDKQEILLREFFEEKYKQHRNKMPPALRIYSQLAKRFLIPFETFLLYYDKFVYEHSDTGILARISKKKHFINQIALDVLKESK